MSKPYEVIITTHYGLNIRLATSHNRRRSSCNFMRIDEAIIFADSLKNALSPVPNITSLGECYQCGQHCYKNQKMFQLADQNRYIHFNCLSKAVENQSLPVNENIVYIKPNPCDVKSHIEDSTSDDSKFGFQFSLRTTNEGQIHIVFSTGFTRIKHNAYFTPEECSMLIQDIHSKIEELKASEIEPCYWCGKIIRIDCTRYVLKNGGLVHGTCMSAFLQSEKSAEGVFPAKLVYPNDCFGLRQSFSEHFLYGSVGD